MKTDHLLHTSQPIRGTHNKWKSRQDAVYWINSARAQDKGLHIWQTPELYAALCRQIASTK